MQEEKNYKKQILIIFILLLVVILGTAIFGVLDNFNGCGTEAHCFRRLITSSSYQHISVPTLSVFVVVLLLLFLNPQIYRAWRKFAIVALPIIIAWIAVSPKSGGGGVGGVGAVGGFDREIMTLTLSVLFFLISLALIIYKSVRSRKIS